MEVTSQRLRVAYLTVHPVLVWDDGENLAPGPPLQPVTIPLAEMPNWLDGLPAQLEKVAEQAAAPADLTD